MSIKLLLYLLLIIFHLITSKEDPNTFSNYEQIKLTNIEANFNVDFNQKIIQSTVKLFFKAEADGEVIVLDCKNLYIQKIIDSNTGYQLPFTYETDYELESIGIPLKIYISFSSGDLVTLLITYYTLPSSSAVQWLSKEQTEGKKYPYMFTNCFSIAARQLLPTQDTPLIKTPVTLGITVPKPLFGLFAGIYENSIDNGNSTTYFYIQKIPIPSYLIAMAVGNIEQRKISDRTKIYGEPEIVDKAAWEFEETESFIQLAESYLSPYLWGEYNLLILPSSFPFGGMENPTLTFVTPSLVAGDRSSSSVIVHELCHSWSGNLVTMNNWSDFWLNEGFTVFLERKLIEKIKGTEIAKLSALNGYQTLLNDIEDAGASKSFSSLHPYLLGRNPDDAFNEVPYEKGFNFLYYLEKIINDNSKKEEIDLFRKILRNYFDKYKYQSINYEQFKESLNNTVIKELGEKEGKQILNQIDWVNWIIEPGESKIKNDFSNKYTEEVDEYVKKFYDNELDDDFIEMFKSWEDLVKKYFLKKIQDNKNNLDEVQHDFLSNKLNLKEGYNAGINYNFFNIVLTHVTKDYITQDEFDKIDQFLGHYGLISYCRNLYIGLYKIDKEKALSTFEKYKNRYHPMVARLIEEDFKRLS